MAPISDRSFYAGTIYLCEIHGEHENLICTICYGRQQERVERESVSLRAANTSEAIRKRVLAVLAQFNGTGETHGRGGSSSSP
jgi:hypothetical protein